MELSLLGTAGGRGEQVHKTNNTPFSPLLVIMQSKLPSSQILPLKVVNAQTLIFFFLISFTPKASYGKNWRPERMNKLVAGYGISD